MRRIAASPANPFEIAGTERRTLRPVSSIAASAARRGRTITIVDLVLLQPPILARASESCPTSLGIVDAVRLATALVWQDRMT